MAQRQVPAPAWSFSNGDPLDLVAFWAAVAETGHQVIHRAHWSTDLEQLPDPIDGAWLLHTSAHGETALVERGDWLASVCLEGGTVRLTVAAPSRAIRDEAVAAVAELVPHALATGDSVPVTFWSYGRNGPQFVSRRLLVAPWDAIAGNYPSETGGLLVEMMAGFRPSHGGQLVLWQGLPGTGKTHALRALASEWRTWADLHYIVDPDQLFGEHADYLIEVLLHDHHDLIQPSDMDDARAERWRVLVLEDTGELLAADAKQQTGQALSRLLNTVDGMIGQGLRILVLVTTNEELRRLHPAVQRPGRCAAQITFSEFGSADADRWARSHGVKGFIPDGSYSLADLYAAANDYAQYAQQPSERVVGFAS